MTTFSVRDAAFTGFRVVRERPWIVGFWALAQLVVGVVSTVLLVAVAGPQLAQLQALLMNPPKDMAGEMQLVHALTPIYQLMAPISLVYYAILFAAMNRAVLRPEQSAFGYLRLGLDELRQAGLLLITWVILFLTLIIAALPAAIVGASAGVAFGQGPQGAAVADAIELAFMAGALIFVGVKLSLASPRTFALGKIDMGGAWTLSRGQFWRMLGAYALAAVLLAAMTFLAAQVIDAALTTLGDGGPAKTLAKVTLADPSTYFSPPSVVYMLMFAFFFALFSPVWLTPPAEIYVSLTAGGDTRPADQTFS